MDEKRRSKRKSMDDGFWDCSVCTYRNTPEAFKCDMCDVRKGTSTRKPRINPQLVAQQVAQQFVPPPEKKKTFHKKERVHKDSTTEDKDSIEQDFKDENNEMKEEMEPIEDNDSDIKEEKESEEKADISGELDQPDSVMKEEEDQDFVTPVKETDTKDTVVKDKPSSSSSSHGSSNKKSNRPPRLKNIDRSSGQSMEVTVGGLTVIITDYKPKKDRNSSGSVALANSQDKSECSPASRTISPATVSPQIDSANNSRSENLAERQLNGDIEMEDKNR